MSEHPLSSDDSGVFGIAPAANGVGNVGIGTPVNAPSTPPFAVNSDKPSSRVDKSELKQPEHRPFQVPLAVESSVKLPDFAPPAARAKPVAASATVGPKRSQQSPGIGRTESMPQEAPALNAPASPVPAAIRIALPNDNRRTIPYSKWRRTVKVSARKLTQPAHCACCQSTPDSTYEAVHVRSRGSRSSQHLFTFPYCSSCLDHIRRARVARIRSTIAGWLAFVLLVVFGAVLKLWLATIVLAPLIAIVACFVIRRIQLNQVRQRMSATCACVGPAVRYAGFYGSIQTFDFANEGFASRFEQANAGKIV